MKLLLCELDVLLAEDSVSAIATLVPDAKALLARLRRVAPLRVASASDTDAALLGLLLPFLALHQVGVDALATAGRSVPLAEGALALITALTERGWAVRLCSSVYEPYPSAVAARLGLAEEHVIATPYPEESLSADLGAYALASISELGEDLATLRDDDVPALASRVERFYMSDISYSGFAEALEEDSPLAAEDWVLPAEEALRDLGLAWRDSVVVGCSAGAGPLLDAARAGGGLALVVGSKVISRGESLGDLTALLPRLEAWQPRA